MHEIVLGERDAPDGWSPFELRLQIRSGWHINANPASLKYLIPTEVQGKVRRVTYPEGEIFQFDFAKDELAVYSGNISIAGEVDPKETSLRLVYQACDDRRCLPPVEQTVLLPTAR